MYKVISVEEQDDFQYTITAVLHNESKYAVVEENEVLEHREATKEGLRRAISRIAKEHNLEL